MTPNEERGREQQEAEAILASLHHASHTHTTDEPGEPRRLIDVHIYDLSADGEELPPECSSQDDEDDDEDQHEAPPSSTTTPTPPTRRRVPWRSLVLLGCALALASGVLMGQVLPALTPSATLTIVPVTVPIQTSSTLTVGEGPSAQVPGRALPTLTMSQQRTIATTGIRHQQASAARGLITFYNAALRAQVVPAGTVLTTPDGVQVVTEQPARIAAGSLATNGQTSVAAHALQMGPAGNLAASAIYGPCCQANVFAASGAFMGGQEARSEHVVEQRDRDEEVQALTHSLQHSVTSLLQGQVRTGETLLTLLPCTSTITMDHQVGEEATQVAVRVDETCSGIITEGTALQDAAGTVLQQVASTQVGEHYGLVGTMQTSITQVRGEPGASRVQVGVHSVGTWAYQFTQAQVQRLKAEIAGLPVAQARTRALHLAGVQMVGLTVNRGERVPRQTERITVLWMSAV